MDIGICWGSSSPTIDFLWIVMVLVGIGPCFKSGNITGWSRIGTVLPSICFCQVFGCGNFCLHSKWLRGREKESLETEGPAQWKSIGYWERCCHGNPGDLRHRVLEVHSQYKERQGFCLTSSEVWHISRWSVLPTQAQILTALIHATNALEWSYQWLYFSLCYSLLLFSRYPLM